MSSIQGTTSDCDVGTVQVQYAFQYTDDVNCQPSTPNTSPLAPVTVVIPENGAALNVLEQSVGISEIYRFKATYFGPVLGYFINEINGTAENDDCFWGFLTQAPGTSEPVLANVGVSSFLIRTDGYSIFMRYLPLSDSDHGIYTFLHLNLNQLLLAIIKPIRRTGMARQFF